MRSTASRRWLLLVGSGIIAASLVAARLHAQPPEPTFPEQLARMYPVSSAVVWHTVLEIFKEHHLATRSVNQEGQFLSTPDIAVDENHFGFAVQAIDPSLLRAYAELHVYVPPFVEPARVYVGSRIEGVGKTRTTAFNTGLRLRFYNASAIGQWLLGEVANRVGSNGFAIPKDLVARTRLAQSLHGQVGPCAARIVSGNLPREGLVKPVSMHTERPEIPPGAGRPKSASVTVDAAVMEDGSVWPGRILKGAAASDPFGGAVLATLSFWRFKPGRIENCPVPTTMTFVAAFQ